MGLGNRKQECVIPSYEAETAVSEGYAVGFGTSDDQVVAITATDTRIAGIPRYTREIGGRVDLVVFGPTTGVAGAAIVPGDRLEADVNGRLIPVATPSAGHCAGTSFGTAAALGDTFTVFVGLGR